MHFVLSLSVTAKALPNFNLLDTRETNVEFYGAGEKRWFYFLPEPGIRLLKRAYRSS